ncbi:hypothetical protein NIES2135_04970 [Leptolyngbya boryana NIES-2135]|jgi:hypothetical protein|uniref:Uncharacterized protein n=1 Tax=Leptolyngbya boryana NIES-2135 TaxID=1973484 RepID=A0A1Z4JB63_LEPBY|nr:MULTISPECIES: hypothetical protein [Leptolyngbya]MBD2367873.1 hypothetical protein [Leptolyngbya sp. FACHB-161]MBD2374279.1 hypothetical protein [Leptolyngbya sp. FACHB-238]BAY53687.1 hypothetical protein NIES2135_04970 [Leptolyngbya boryana NIES-2135]MBD2408315.1 hypothetical protein [Leptolyngbya sp. FACHB-402]ULP30653.1 hypothetical protein MCP04_02520 [Leptolyngbya boryana IU 594]
MTESRLRLSDRARKRLQAMSDKSDVDVSFFLEYLINRFGSQAVLEMTNGAVTITSEPIEHKAVSTVPIVESKEPYRPISDPKAALNDTKEHYPPSSETKQSLAQSFRNI